ncbi:uncharacterized protein [Amphiura filiformis]|uniref:uncharacterized protein n=1 Tax=Amphiura filiformis TaxID=82378 RepID=UPI003B214D47
MISYFTKRVCVLCVVIVFCQGQTDAFILTNFAEEEQIQDNTQKVDTNVLDPPDPFSNQPVDADFPGLQDPSANQPGDTDVGLLGLSDPSSSQQGAQGADGGGGTLLADEGLIKNRTKRRDTDCGRSPEGVKAPCISCDGSDSTLFTDVNGLQCWCEICRPPKYMRVPCICGEGHEVLSGPTCSLPKHDEEFMAHSNWCDRPFKCSKCKGDLIVTFNCTAYIDTICNCPKDTYHANETICQPIPTCDIDYEIQEIRTDTRYSTYECRPCKEGFTQQEQDSWERCVEKNAADTTEPPANVGDKTDGQRTDNHDAGHLSPSSGNPPSTKSTSQLPSEQVNCSLACPCNFTEAQYSTDTLITNTSATDKDHSNCNDTNTYGILNAQKSGHDYWHIIVITLLVIAIFVCIPISLVYGSKHPEKVEWLATKIGVHGWIYRSLGADLDQCSEQGLPQSGESSGSLADVTTDGDETQRLTLDSVEESSTSAIDHSVENPTGHRLFNEESAKGGRRGMAQKKYATKRSSSKT